MNRTKNNLGTRTAGICKPGKTWSTRRLSFSMQRPFRRRRKSSPPDSLPMMCCGTYSVLPCSITMNDLSNSAVSLLPGLYITSTRHSDIEGIRTTLHQLPDNIWNILTACGTRKQVFCSDDIAYLALCSWLSSPFNIKLTAGFYHVAQDTLTITLNDEHIMFKASNLEANSAENLLNILACVTLATEILDPNGPVGKAIVEVTTTGISRFCVAMKVRLPSSYMQEVKTDEGRLRSVYGHIAASLQ